MDVLVHSMVGALSRCIHIASHHAAHLKHIIIYFVNYTSTKLGGKKKEIGDLQRI